MPQKIQDLVSIPLNRDQTITELVRLFREVAKAVNPMIDGQLFQLRSVKSSTTLRDYDSVILADCSAGAITINLLPADECEERRIVVKKIDPSTNLCILDPDGAETIDDAAKKTLAAQYERVEIVSDGTEWWIVS